MSAEAVCFVNARGQRLAGRLHGTLGDAVVVSCHGMMSTKDGTKHVLLGEELARRGVPMLRFDFAGRGESEGSLFDLCCTNEVGDLTAAIDFLAAKGVERFALFGSSLGGAVALLTAARDERVVAIATLAAVGHLAALAESQPEAMSAWESVGYVETPEGRLGRGFLDDARAHDVIAAVRVLRAPVLVIHGEDDATVPAADAHDIASAARSASLDLVAGAGHTFERPMLLRPVVRQIADFLVQALR